MAFAQLVTYQLKAAFFARKPSLGFSIEVLCITIDNFLRKLGALWGLGVPDALGGEPA